MPVPASSEEALFDWIISNFGLNDAIESGLVKTPRVVVRDDGVPGAKTYKSKLYHIYEHVEDDLDRHAEEQVPLPDLVPPGTICALARHLRLELVELLLLLLDLRLLRRHLLLQRLFLLLPLLHLIADQGAADQADGGADAGAGAGKTRRRADDRPQSSAGKCADRRPLLRRRKRLRTAGEHQSQ